MEHSVNIPIFNVPGILFCEYSLEFHREPSWNIPGIYHGNVLRIFHEHKFARWVHTAGIYNYLIYEWIHLKESIIIIFLVVSAVKELL